MDSRTRPSRHGLVLLWITLAVALVCSSLAVIGVLSGARAAIGCLPLAVVIAFGVAIPRSGVFAQPVLAVRTARRELALTFDDGPDPRWTPALLDLLDARGHRATFFVIGARAEKYPALLRDVARRGHELANHTWSHSYCTVFYSPASLASELRRTNQLLEAASGRAPRWFRPPVGLLSPRVPLGVRLAGLELVGWTATARDGVAGTSAIGALARLAPAVLPGSILAMHDAPIRGDRPLIIDHLMKQLLDLMDETGLKSVTLSELCADDRR